MGSDAFVLSPTTEMRALFFFFRRSQPNPSRPVLDRRRTLRACRIVPTRTLRERRWRVEGQGTPQGDIPTARWDSGVSRDLRRGTIWRRMDDMRDLGGGWWGWYEWGREHICIDSSIRDEALSISREELRIRPAKDGSDRRRWNHAQRRRIVLRRIRRDSIDGRPLLDMR